MSNEGVAVRSRPYAVTEGKRIRSHSLLELCDRRFGFLTTPFAKQHRHRAVPFRIGGMRAGDRDHGLARTREPADHFVAGVMVCILRFGGEPGMNAEGA